MLTAEQVARFRADGFVKGVTVLDHSELQMLRAELARVINDQARKQIPQPLLLRNLSNEPATPVWQIVNIWQASDPFRRLVHNEAIAEAAGQLTAARELRIWHDQIQYKPAATGGVNMWHQDSPYWPPLEPKDGQITAWVALDDVDESNGCMSMVPGSHMWGNQIEFLHTIKSFDAMPKEFEGRALHIRTCPVRAGEVHFHHALAWHGSGANTSTRPRRAIAIHFMTDRTRFNERGGEHPLRSSITVADGEFVQGAAFPVVWRATR